MIRTTALLVATLLIACLRAYAQDPSRETATPTRPQYVVLTPVFFDVNSTALTEHTRAALVSIAKVLAANADARLTVVGHTDERGSDAYNLRLGRRRAEAAAAFLLDQGIAVERLDIRSAGERQPMAPGHDEAAWSQNRRVEFQAKGTTPLRIPPR